jgi:DNA-binding PadR family transcriptional regulator
MLTTTESNVLHRARRDGYVEVAWDSSADQACETLVEKGWLVENQKRGNYYSHPMTVVYEITEEGKHG